MTHQSPTHAATAPNEPGRQVAQLRHVLALVEQIAGRECGEEARGAALDEAARVSAAYDHSLSIDRRRFDTLAAETARWAAAGVEALLALEEREIRPQAPAARLADELSRTLKRLADTVSA